MSNNTTEARTDRYPIWRRLLKIALWTLFAVILLIYGTVTCVVKLLSPERLTPIVVELANEAADAEVYLSRAELGMQPSYPFLSLSLDSLCIVSPEFKKQNNDTIENFPAYADTLLYLSHFSGGINLLSLTHGCVSINEVSIKEPIINFVAINETENNFSVFTNSNQDTSSELLKSESPIQFPHIELRRFTIDGPALIRYFDLSTGTNLDLNIEAMIENSSPEKLYHLTFGGNVTTPLLQMINRSNIDFSLNGDIDWSSLTPFAVRMNDCTLGIDILKAKFNLEADFAQSFLLKSFDAELNSVEIQRLIEFIPDSLSKEYGLNKLRTDAHISLTARLDSVFNLETDSVPYATLNAVIEPSVLNFGRAKFHDVAADLSVITKGNDIDKSEFIVNDFSISGSATRLRLSATVANVMADPKIECSVDGFTDFSLLPEELLRLVDGSLSGTVNMALQAKFSKSMLTKNNFHKLGVNGNLNLNHLYWLSSDTANMTFINSALLDFGTNRRINSTSENMLAAGIKIDSLDVLTGTLGIRATELSLGLASENTASSADTTLVNPMGGGLRVKTLDFSAITDSAGARFRNIAGRVIIRRFKELKKVPEFIFDLGIDRMAAGAPDASVLFSNSKLHFSAHKLPQRKPSKALQKLADSIKMVRPELPMDSVYRLAIARHNRTRKPYHRVHTIETDTTSEIIEWGTSPFVGKLLLDWKLDGQLSADRARFYTPHFPLRNRLENLNLKFNNDSITIKDMVYKVGRSDFLAVGRVSDIRKALTRKQGRYPLKVLFETESDTVDVNQLADAFFRGAAYGKGHKTNAYETLDIDDELEFDRQIDALESDSVAPLLIPLNLEAEIRVKARNVLYSDLMLHNLSGDMLLYDGALNLHQLKAASDVGSVDLTALYSAPDLSRMQFGFGLKVNRFDIKRFMEFVPALDTIMPLLNDISGIINADIAATVDIDENMDLKLPTLTAAVKLQGDSLQLLDRETFRTIAKWLMFKDKQRNIIDSMTVEMVIAENQMDLFPFIFNIDRYKLGIQGHNDLALNFNYLISVLKSPLPFKFGITLKGNPDDYKIRLGRAKFDEKQAVERRLIVDTTRVNLVDQIENVFRRGVRKSKFAQLNISPEIRKPNTVELDGQVSASDSLLFIQEGLIVAPEEPAEKVINKKEK